MWSLVAKGACHLLLCVNGILVSWKHGARCAAYTFPVTRRENEDALSRAGVERTASMGPMASAGHGAAALNACHTAINE
jgi:hypothetical protein